MRPPDPSIISSSLAMSLILSHPLLLTLRDAVLTMIFGFAGIGNDRCVG